VVIPSGIVTTGWPQVVRQCALMGIRFEGWQDGLGRVALGKRSDGKYAATIGGVVLSIPRQVGKTFFVGALMMALCVLFPGYTVLWTAHRQRTATRTFQSLQRMAKWKKVAPFVRHIRAANGEQEIAFTNGSTILFGAREQGFGRGFDEVDAIVFDEAQILTDKALEDMVAATNQSRHPHGALLFFMGTPPRPVDPGDAFTFKRAQALAGKSRDIAYVEMSADEDADPDDRVEWAKANPSFPELTPLESMLRMRENLPSVDSWMREGLGVWDADSSAAFLTAWESCVDAGSAASGVPVFAVDVSPHSTSAAVVAVTARPDGLPHVELVRHDAGTGWVVEECARVDRNNDPVAWVLDPNSPAGVLLPELAERGIAPIEVTNRQMGQACEALTETAKARGLRHLGDPAFPAAIKGAGRRDIGDGLWAWSRIKSDLDICPLVAVTLALWGFSLYGGEGLGPGDVTVFAKPVTKQREFSSDLLKRRSK
jgi:phage terminase large subunit-like protein